MFPDIVSVQTIEELAVSVYGDTFVKMTMVFIQTIFCCFFLTVFFLHFSCDFYFLFSFCVYKLCFWFYFDSVSFCLCLEKRIYLALVHLFIFVGCHIDHMNVWMVTEILVYDKHAFLSVSNSIFFSFLFRCESLSKLYILFISFVFS